MSQRRFHRPDLIDEWIEAAVAEMQSVIELGRYIRDVKVMPIKVRTVASLSLSLSLSLAHNNTEYTHFFTNTLLHNDTYMYTLIY